MRVIFVFLCFLFAEQTSAQKLSCADFKKGTFTIKSPKSDQVVTIVRDSISQIETVTVKNKVLEAFEIIQWIDECSYRLKYDSSKMELDDTQKLVNAFNGIVVTHLSFTEKCSIYEAVLTRPDGAEIKQSLEICKKK